MSQQQVHCRICAKLIYTTFSFDDKETCPGECAEELRWRQKLATTDRLYTPRSKARYIRIAELDPMDELDSLIKDLESIPGLIIERYLIPKEAYHIFATHPPPIGLDFPIATLEGAWEKSHGTDNRIYGFLGVKAFLRELRISAFAVTRKIKKSQEKQGTNG